MNSDLLLGDGFDEFTKQITALRNRKKALKQELKSQYDRITSQMAEIDEVAAQLLRDFEDGVMAQSTTEGKTNGPTE